MKKALLVTGGVIVVVFGFLCMIAPKEDYSTYDAARATCVRQGLPTTKQIDDCVLFHAVKDASAQ